MMYMQKYGSELAPHDFLAIFCKALCYFADFGVISPKPLLLILASREVNIMFQRLLWDDLNKSLQYA